MCVCNDVSYVHKFKCNSFKLFTILIVRFDGIAVALNCSRLDRNTFSKVQNTKTATYTENQKQTESEEAVKTQVNHIVLAKSYTLIT